MSALGAKLKSIFTEFDSNKEAVIPREKLIDILKGLDPTWTQEELNTLFEIADKDGNGVIDYNEFIDFICYMDEDPDVKQKEVSPAVVEAMTKMFKLYDLDNSGFITIDESLAMDRAFSEACGLEFDEAKARETFTKGDTNKDAKVTVEEFIADMKRTAAKNNLSDDALLEYVQMTNEMLTANLEKATISLDDALVGLFTIQDIDRSGFITLDESLKMDKLFSEVSGVPFDEAETAIIKEFQEFLETAQHDLKETFTQTDTNQDGKVSLEEFKAYFKKTATEAGLDEKAQLGVLRQTNDMMLLAKEEDDKKLRDMQEAKSSS